MASIQTQTGWPESIEVEVGRLVIHQQEGHRHPTVTLDGEKVAGLKRLVLTLDANAFPEVTLTIMPTVRSAPSGKG